MAKTYLALRKHAIGAAEKIEHESTKFSLLLGNARAMMPRWRRWRRSVQRSWRHAIRLSPAWPLRGHADARKTLLNASCKRLGLCWRL